MPAFPLTSSLRASTRYIPSLFLLLSLYYHVLTVSQTRGWFYTLMVLSTALFDKPAFRNVIVNGLVLSAYHPVHPSFFDLIYVEYTLFFFLVL
jgi:hypothetical protein